MVKALCIKEKLSREVLKPEYKIAKNGRIYVSGKCAKCGETCGGFIKASDAPAHMAREIANHKPVASKKKSKKSNKGGRKV